MIVTYYDGNDAINKARGDAVKRVERRMGQGLNIDNRIYEAPTTYDLAFGIVARLTRFDGRTQLDILGADEATPAVLRAVSVAATVVAETIRREAQARADESALMIAEYEEIK